MYEKYYKQDYSIDEFYKLNIKVCNELQDMLNIDVKFRIKTRLGEIEIDEQIIDALFEIPLKTKPNTRIVYINVPYLGGHSEVDVAEVYVKVGDKVNINDNLLMLETAKATMEITADNYGIVTEVLVNIGSKVNEGDLIVKLEVLSNE